MTMAYPYTEEEELQMRVQSMNREQRRKFDKLIKRGLSEKDAAKKVLGVLGAIRSRKT